MKKEQGWIFTKMARDHTQKKHVAYDDMKSNAIVQNLYSIVHPTLS
ncbi:hypothetical protein [Lysinibacillus contaminans]|nr:hypothetical protein [Lysinibacillus contaminans]